eukprot:TRINITY_DN18155_c0_g1_i1.p1 TRINITY_DN18155_c0_g1~~TRINITY_DN18155_c0_g1_i1.p1  ORF type:complete len:372 (-),score=164.36 TRINITY_DN18155_c0_g1_i1:69-1184(-)
MCIRDRKGIVAEVKKETRALAQAHKTVADSGQAIKDIAMTLQAAKANLSTTFMLAKNSLQLYKAHSGAASANRTDGDEDDVGSGTSTEHEEYLRQAAAIRQMHATRAQAINSKHSAALAINDLEQKLIVSKDRRDEIQAEVKQSDMLIKSLGYVEEVEDSPGGKKRRPKRKRAATFKDMLKHLKGETDSYDAFSMLTKLEAKAKNGGGKQYSPQAKAKLDEEMTMAQMTVSKYEEEAKALKENAPTPQVIAAQAALAAAERGGNKEKVSMLKEKLQLLMKQTAQQKKEKKALAALQTMLAQAKKSGNSAKVEAIQEKLLFTTNSLDPNSLEAMTCLLYTSDAADDLLCVDLGGRRIIKKKIEYKVEMTDIV